MRIDWTEPMSRRLVRRRFAEMRQGLASILPTVLWGTGAALAICVAVRLWLPGASEALGWAAVLRLACVLLVVFLAFPFLGAVLPLLVHLTESGIAFQEGSSVSFLKWEQIVSVSFVDADGLRLFKVEGTSKKGKPVVWTAVASSKVREEDVMKCLYDLGQAHLWKRA